MNHFRAFTNTLSSAARDLTKDFSTSTTDRPVSNGRQYKIGSKTVTEEKLLSEGGFGFVHLVREVPSNAPYVIKKILCQDKERYELACREIEMFEKLPLHPNLVRYYGHIIERNAGSREVIILMEFCSGGHLYDMMQRCGSHVPVDKIMKALRDVTAGLVALDRMNPPVQHRDLKLENVLVNSQGNFVLVDFGSWSSDAPDLSKLPRDQLMQFGEIVERYTTLMYRPPEMADLYKGFKISGKVDIWMLGCMLFTLINNRHPFQNASNLAIVNCRYSFSQDECKRYPPKLTELCAWLLAQSPDDRPSAQQLSDILATWSDSEALPLPQSVLDRIEKDARLYGIPMMAGASRQKRSASAPSVVAEPVWGDKTAASPRDPSWEADFPGPLGDKPPAKVAVTTVALIPDLLG